MKINVCIPSYDRPDWPALGWLMKENVPRNWIHLFVDTPREAYKYSQYRNLDEINLHITNTRGIHKARERILEEIFPERILMLDDDVTGLYRFGLKGNKPRAFLETVWELFEKSKGLSCQAWGLNYYRNAWYASKMKEMDVGKYFGASLWGVEEYKCSLESELSEDMEFQLNCIRDGVEIVRFNQYGIDVQHNTKGGCDEAYRRRNGDQWEIYQKLVDRFLPEIGVERFKEFRFRPFLNIINKKVVGVCVNCMATFPSKMFLDQHRKYPCGNEIGKEGRK